MKKVYSLTIWSYDRCDRILNDVRVHTMDEIYEYWLKFIHTKNLDYYSLATIEELTDVKVMKFKYMRDVLIYIQEYLEILE